MTDNRKQAICNALRAFIKQRPGFDFANYGDMTAYRGDQRTAQKQLHDARAMLRQVELSDGITADAMLAAADGRGRLSITIHKAKRCKRCEPGALQPCAPDCPYVVGVPVVSWCTGQYWPMEFRAGVARYLASLLWGYKREHCMPAPTCYGAEGNKYQHNGRWVSGGDWLRASFRREFGKGLAGRYFN